MFMSCLEMSTRFMAMFLLVFGRHICVPQRDTNMAGVSKQSSINLGNTFLRIPRKRKNCTDLNRSKTFCIDSWSNLLISTQVSKLAKKQIKKAKKIQLSMEMTTLLRDDSKGTASTSYYLGDKVWKKSARRA